MTAVRSAISSLSVQGSFLSLGLGAFLGLRFCFFLEALMARVLGFLWPRGCLCAHGLP